MNNFFKPSLFFLLLLIFFSCKKNDDSVPADLSPPELTYLQINGEDINDDHIHVSLEKEFSIRFNFIDNVSVMEGEFRLIINNSEELSKTIDSGGGSSNYKFTFGLPNLMNLDNLNGTDNYIVQPDDQIKFILSAKDDSDNFTERTIAVIVF